MKEEPIDLTKNPVLAQKVDDVKPEPPKPEAEPVRRVYGLRKVYSTGIGEGGSASDAVIGKQGDTLNADIDTLPATPKDLKGGRGADNSITKLAKSKYVFKPEYTQGMTDAKVAGNCKSTDFN